MKYVGSSFASAWKATGNRPRSTSSRGARRGACQEITNRRLHTDAFTLSARTRKACSGGAGP